MRWLALAVAWTACRDKPSPAPNPEPAPPTAQRPAPAPAPRPELAPADAAGPIVPPGARSPDQLFADEPIDGAWKASTEQEVRAHLSPRLGKPQVECRRTTCRLVITGSRQELSAAFDDLQQLHKIAKSVTFTGTEQRPDGKYALRAFLGFERPAEP